MRITRSDVDLWRAREMQGLRRLAEASPFSSQERRPEPTLRRASSSRRRLVDRTEQANAAPPIDDQLSDTVGNVTILQHLLDSVLPALDLPADVRLAAASLLSEDMNHHLRVLGAGLTGEEDLEEGEPEAEPDGRLG